MSFECVECHKKFPNAHALSCHTSRENSKLKEEDRCGYKFKNKRLAQEKQEEIKQAKRKLSHLDPTKIIETININDLLKENAELKDQLQNKSEEYLKGLANDEIRKLKSHIQGLEKRIQELESYIEERKDVTSKAEDVIRNCKCKMFRGYRQELV